MKSVTRRQTKNSENQTFITELLMKWWKIYIENLFWAIFYTWIKDIDQYILIEQTPSF